VIRLLRYRNVSCARTIVSRRRENRNVSSLECGRPLSRSAQAAASRARPPLETVRERSSSGRSGGLRRRLGRLLVRADPLEALLVVHVRDRQLRPVLAVRAGRLPPAGRRQSATLAEEREEDAGLLLT